MSRDDLLLSTSSSFRDDLVDDLLLFRLFEDRLDSTDGSLLLSPDTDLSLKVRSDFIVSDSSSSSSVCMGSVDHLLRLTRGRVETEEGSVEMVGSILLWYLMGILNIGPLKDSLMFSVGSSNAKELSEGWNCRGGIVGWL